MFSPDILVHIADLGPSVLMTPSADTDLLLDRSYEDTETTPLHVHEAGDGAVLEPSEEVASISNNPGYELEDLATGFARVPTNILDVASGLCIHEFARLLPDHSASDSGPHDSSSDFLRYANIERLSKFIPACDPHSKVARTCRVIMSRREVMLSMQTSLAFFVFLINVALAAWATKVHPTPAMIGSFFTGNCARIKNINIGLHFLLNVLSSLFLGAGNYCMQVVVAPTGEEVRSAHASGRYFDIGVHSIHNLRHVSWHRRVTWLGLGICSTLLHLM
jgi:hypothetical protein